MVIVLPRPGACLLGRLSSNVRRLGKRLDLHIHCNYTVVVAELRFAWDGCKTSANERKHGVSFDEAESVFFDEHAILVDDAEHSHSELRFVLRGISSKLRVVVVSHTLCDRGDTIRIISARKAIKREQEQYFERVAP